MTRRSDEELVEEMIQYLKEKKGSVTQGELCNTLKLNQKTAEKWLKIGLLFKNECPDYVYEQAGRFWIIRLLEEDAE